MAAPSKSWVVISDAMVDADSPLDTTLMTGLRDDLVHLEEWLGMSYTAAQDHDHDGTNSKGVVVPDGTITPAKLKDYAGGTDWLLAQDAGTVRSHTTTTPTKKKEIQLSRGGTVQVQFDFAHSAGGQWAQAQIYRNGVAVGAMHETNTAEPSYDTINENIGGWVSGDLIQLYINNKPASAGTTYCKNFKAYASWTKATVTLD